MNTAEIESVLKETKAFVEELNDWLKGMGYTNRQKKTQAFLDTINNAIQKAEVQS